jgi:hypothetical protein
MNLSILALLLAWTKRFDSLLLIEADVLGLSRISMAFGETFYWLAVDAESYRMSLFWW